MTDATQVANAVTDPVARKLIEWVILRAEDDEFSFQRYANFIAANPGWPGTTMFRRKAEASLWQDRADENTVRGFFATTRPISGKGRLRDRARGDGSRATAATGRSNISARPGATMRSAPISRRRFWIPSGRYSPAAITKYGWTAASIPKTPTEECAPRNGLAAPSLRSRKARIAVIDKSSNTKALLDAVPEDARRDAGYMFNRIQWLRRNEKFDEAAQLMLAAPRRSGNNPRYR